MPTARQKADAAEALERVRRWIAKGRTGGLSRAPELFDVVEDIADLAALALGLPTGQENGR